MPRLARRTVVAASAALLVRVGSVAASQDAPHAPVAVPFELNDPR